jgi:hypothetical protein
VPGANAHNLRTITRAAVETGSESLVIDVL